MSNTLIYGVDSDPLARLMLESIFGADNEVELFPSAELCLARIEERRPGIVITDTRLPGIDGFEFCFRLKQNPQTSETKILVVSAEGDMESRLHAYDIGVDDFLLKPYAIDEIRHKIAGIQRTSRREASIKGQAADSEYLTNILLSNMDEYAVLIKFMRSLNGCTSEQDVAHAALEMMSDYQLDGVAKISLPNLTFCVGPQGENLPRDLSILAHIKSMDRIFSFRNRTTFNYDRVTLLVNNMPLDDPDRCGRLRDHLAIAAETADGKLEAIYLTRRDANITGAVSGVVDDIRTIISDYVSKQKLQDNKGTEMINDLIQTLNASFSSLGLSADLEEEIEEMIKRTAYSIISIYGNADTSAHALAELEQRLTAAVR